MMTEEATPVTKIFTDGSGNNLFGNGGIGALILGWLFGAGMSGNGFFGGANGGANSPLYQQLASLQNQISDNANNSSVMDAINSFAAANGTSQAAVLGAINGLSAAFQSGCCECKTGIMESGYQNQLANCQQTNTILQQSQSLQNTMQNLGSSLGFQIERNACDIRENSTANTQKIIDTLNGHWNLEQQTTIQQLRDEIGRLNQTQDLIAALKTTTTTAGA